MHLIENTTDGARAFLSLSEGRRIGHAQAWSGDPEKALQFVRAEDAQAYIDTHMPNQAPYVTVAKITLHPAAA